MPVSDATPLVEVHPDLPYIQITAWATVALVIGTIFMIWWQIRAAKEAAKVQMSLQLMDQYDGPPMRAHRQRLASILLQGSVPAPSAMEPVLDVLETIADLHRRKWLEPELIENGFSVPIRYWWLSLKQYIVKMRQDYHDSSIYEDFERLAESYNDKETKPRKAMPLSEQDIRVFLSSEAS